MMADGGKTPDARHQTPDKILSGSVEHREPALNLTDGRRVTGDWRLVTGDWRLVRRIGVDKRTG